MGFFLIKWAPWPKWVLNRQGPPDRPFFPNFWKSGPKSLVLDKSFLGPKFGAQKTLLKWVFLGQFLNCTNSQNWAILWIRAILKIWGAHRGGPAEPEKTAFFEIFGQKNGKTPYKFFENFKKPKFCPLQWFCEFVQRILGQKDSTK